MANEKNRDWTAIDLPVVQYLNQRITFDLLATLEDGFSHLTTMETHSQGISSSETSGQAGFGVSNIFAFLGVSLGGRISSGASDSTAENSRETEHLVHTPTSLFARLRNELRSENLVKDVTGPDSIDKLVGGCFVEFEATLHRHQLMEMLEAFETLLPIVSNFDEESNKTRKNRQNNSQKSEQQIVLEQITSMRAAISGTGSRDLIAKIGNMGIVLTVEDSSFIEPTMNDVLDGTFRVFGKVTRAITENSESINLLRRSSLSKFPTAMDVLSNLTQLEGLEFEGGVPETSINGPTLQVIPIAIFA